MYRHILVATDGSVLANRALEHAVALAKALGSRLSVVTVTPPPSAYASRPDFEPIALDCARQIDIAADEILAGASSLIKANGLKGDTIKLRDEEPFRAILAAANDRHADLIVTASHRGHRMPTAILGGETINVLTHSSVPVLVYRDERPVAAKANAIA